MADSTITKKAIAESLKKIMKDKPFEKISVAEICEDCGLTRKSFYYHFKDKYDLVSWIFDYDFLGKRDRIIGYDMVSFFDDLFKYLYENRSFYRKLFQSDGQNSFHDTFVQGIAPIADGICASVLPNVPPALAKCYVDFFCEGLTAAVKHWLDSGLSDKDFIDATHQAVNETVTFIIGCQMEFSQFLDMGEEE